MEIPWLLLLFHLSFKQCRVDVFVYLDICIFDYLCNCGSVFSSSKFIWKGCLKCIFAVTSLGVSLVHLNVFVYLNICIYQYLCITVCVCSAWGYFERRFQLISYWYIWVFAYLCICTFGYLCISIFVYLGIQVFLVSIFRCASISTG